MSDKDSKKIRSKVVSSEKRNPNEALAYWTKEKMENAKPVSMPESDTTQNHSEDEDSDTEEKQLK